jgi:hypothetical protein
MMNAPQPAPLSFDVEILDAARLAVRLFISA